MPSNRTSPRCTGMIIEVPKKWQDEATSSTFSILEKDVDWQWDNDGESNDDDEYIGLNGVRFSEESNIYHDATPVCQETKPHDLWLRSDEITQFQKEAAKAKEQSPLDPAMQKCLEGVYGACLKTSTESNLSVMTKSNRQRLCLLYSQGEGIVLGEERNLINSFQSDCTLRRLTILRVIHQLSRQSLLPGNKAALLHRENAVRMASQSISRPSRLFAREVAHAQK